jgi:sortase (surface protein transpeptidase)
VIPALGIVTPVLQPSVSRTATQATTFAALDRSFLSGAAIYPDTAELGAVGNSVIGAHSSYWKSHRSAYKTIFTKIPELIPGDEIRGYTRKKKREGTPAEKRDVTIYTVTTSYYMKAFDPHLFDQPSTSKEVSLYTCVPI